ncbi:MAG TPA: phosphatase PAP2 family protein [Solirubrobacteraceae bacterium]|nr:phosphatase PAP2 family protein [Solirubrobacteraceae bacterium]
MSLDLSSAGGLDGALLRLARTRGHHPAAERAVAAFSVLGEHGAIWLALGVLGALFCPGRRRAWMRASGVVGGVYLAGCLVKVAVRRPRPKIPDLPPLVPTPTQLSFPSAHASTSFAAASQYAALGLPAAPLYGVATALSLSRLYLGVHYPSDVVAGAAFGAAVGRRWRWRKNPR